MSTPQPILLPKTLSTRCGALLAGQYRLVRRVGAGGTSTVWIADDLLLERRVAVKILDSSDVDETQARLRFEREAKLASRIVNPHVVQIFAQGRTAFGRPFIVMELLRGEDLATRITRGPLRLSLAASIVHQASQVLGQVHAEGLVHRDIKPHNIFLMREHDGQLFVKLLDFGIAKDGALPSMTQEGTVIGTLAYMSPEQLACASRVSASADVWAMAVTSYEMLTGQPPFSAGSLPELLLKLHAGRFSPITSLQPRLPRQLDALFAKALHRDPRQRFGGIGELSQALVEIARTNRRGRTCRDCAASSQTVGPRAHAVSRGQVAWLAICWLLLAALSFVAVYTLRGNSLAGPHAADVAREP